MHYYQFNIGDYHSHTGHLDLMEDIAYRRMMDYCYLNEISLPDDLDEIARLVRMRTHTDCIAIVLREFFTLTDDGYIQPRIEADLAKYHEKSEKAKKSAEARWKKKPSKDGGLGDANALRPDSEGNANHKPITNNHKPLNNNQIDQSAIDSEFDQVWDLYGKKGNKKTSKARWSKLKDSDKQDIYNHLPAYLLSTPDKQYRKNLETYINQECWNDEVTTNGQQNQSGRTTAPSRQTPAQRTRAAAERWEAEQEGNVQALGGDAGSLRAPVEQPVRGGADGDMGATIDGDFTRAD